MDELDVAARCREIRAGIDLISGVRKEGSYRAYLVREKKELMRIRSLRARGRAHATAATPREIARLLDPAFPREIAWSVLSYWQDTG